VALVSVQEFRLCFGRRAAVKCLRVGAAGEQERGQVGVQGLGCPGVPGVLGVDGAAEQGPSVGRGWGGMIW
jgi:hypothetical protein